MKVYVASSWKNWSQPLVVEALRDDGHRVYDFRNPAPGNNGFHWSPIDAEWKNWGMEAYRRNLSHAIAEEGFQLDMAALRECDAVVGVQPFGISASLEIGWAAGAGKKTVMLLAPGLEPELMAKMCDEICVNIVEVLEVLR